MCGEDRWMAKLLDGVLGFFGGKLVVILKSVVFGHHDLMLGCCSGKEY